MTIAARFFDMFKKLILVFILAFFLSWAWEISHSVLYLNYRGGQITSFILFRASLVDAFLILILVFGALFAAGKFKLNKSLFVALGGLAISVVIEIWALQTGRWAYNPLMPIIPIIRTGLTPTIQLAVTGYIVQGIISRMKAKT